MKASERVVILYEDQSNKGVVKEYGPHLLVMACVAELLGVNPHTLFDEKSGIPKKGNAKLLDACKAEVGGLARGVRWVVAVFDEDQVRRLLALPSTTTDKRVVEHICGLSDDPEHLVVVLLRRNLESILTSLHACEPGLSPPNEFGAALRKDLNARDAMLKRAAFWQNPELRKCLMEQVPSFRFLVHRVACALGPAS